MMWLITLKSENHGIGRFCVLGFLFYVGTCLWVSGVSF